MPDPNLPLLQDAVRKLAPSLNEIVFVGGVTLGLLITDEAAAPIRGTTDVDVIAEIVTYTDYIAFSERLRKASFTEAQREEPMSAKLRRKYCKSAVICGKSGICSLCNLRRLVSISELAILRKSRTILGAMPVLTTGPLPLPTSTGTAAPDKVFQRLTDPRGLPKYAEVV